MNSGEPWRLGKRPALDGLRGVAIALVLLAHFDNPATSPLTGGGIVGVTVFFTLSGFLITALLFDESDRAGRVSLAAFYRRRALRLLPALFTTLVVVLVIQGTWVAMGVEPQMALAAVFYVSNWWQIAHPSVNALSHTWSLGIEEQFYIVWPALFLLGRRWGRRGVQLVAAAGIGVSVLAVFAAGGSVTEGSLERASSLLAGCLLAGWMNGRREGRGLPLLATAGVGALLPLLWLTDVVDVRWYVLGVPVVTSVVLFAAAQGAGPGWLVLSPLCWLGKRSYGIYLWHFPVLFVGFAIMPETPWLVRSAVLLCIALLVAEVSWRYVETPFLRLKDRSRRAEVAAAQPRERDRRACAR